MADSVLDLFCTPVRVWFSAAIGQPTPVQELGWPVIHGGEHSLLLAPTGSGKTLAAFLACLNQLWQAPQPATGQVQLLYVSPLKALNEDIHRNLQQPLTGVMAEAERLGYPLRPLRVAVRTGDTTAAHRRALLKQPPDILITTPESLNLLLTSQGRQCLAHLRWCIVDEIHVLCPSKRGVFLAVLLERLAALQANGEFIRIGLSATQRPLHEVARFLGGVGRAVRIVDAGLRKNLDLQVVCPVDTFGPLPERSIWPAINRYLFDQIARHRSTLIFANNRRTVERLANELNELAEEAGASVPEADRAAPQTETSLQGSSHTETSVPETQTIPQPHSAVRPLRIRPHHGSLSQETRWETEQALKRGELAAVVATASLELGIDMGAVDLVCQVESPGNIARALQRVGRAGHLVGQTSKGRLIPKTEADLLEQAVLAREMLAGNVEHLHTPTGCLDVLAQQIVAMVAVESWDVSRLWSLLRRAYPYRDLSAEALASVLEMLAGRFPGEAFRDLKARISWDRIHNRLHALPGSQQLALINGGTIPDTGQFAAYIAGTQVRVGELDEEFVFERRIGDVFQLGSQAWRIEEIGTDRVIVSRAEGVARLMPFWRGERTARSPDLGQALGQFLRELEDRLVTAQGNETRLLTWLRDSCRLDARAARNLLAYVRRQIEEAGCLPTDHTLLIEACRDELGDWYVAILSPLGSRFHFALRLALEGRWRQRFGYQPQCLHLDDGLLLKVLDRDEPPLDLLEDLDPQQVQDLVLAELANSALFAIRFRQNAMRALLLPRLRPDRRAPLWLQRLKARNLLQVCRQHPQFPVVVETYRECLQDHLDVPRLRDVLSAIRQGRVRIVRRRAERPCPFASSFLFNFAAANMYVYDRVDAPASAAVDRNLLDQLMSGPVDGAGLIDAQVIQTVEQRLQHRQQPSRSKEELADRLRRVGDLRPSELTAAEQSFMEQLSTEGRAVALHLPGSQDLQPRWVLTEEVAIYQMAFRLDGSSNAPISGEATAEQSLPDRSDAAARILRRFLLTHALVGLEDVLDRYPFDPEWARRQLQEWSRAGQSVQIEDAASAASVRWSAPANFTELQRTALARRRREIPTVAPTRFADFLLRWQYRHPAHRLKGPEGLRRVLERLQGLALPTELWEQTLLPSRVADYQGRWLDDLTLSGEWVWQLSADGLLAFWRREDVQQERAPMPSAPLSPQAEGLRSHLARSGAAFVVDLVAATGFSPAAIRAGLWELARAGQVSNDRFDVIRRGPEPEENISPPTRQASLAALRRRRMLRPEGRWALIPWGEPETEPLALRHAVRLLERFGVVSRELARQDDALVPWRVLYEIYSRWELTGEVMRGYFVAGLSGAQFALPEALTVLHSEQHLLLDDEPAILLHSCDPANLWGNAAPLGARLSATVDTPVAEAAAEFSVRRRPRNWLVVRGGRPVLLIEQDGRRLSTWPDASSADIQLAVQVLGEILRTGHGLNLRGKLCVETWNGRPVLEVGPARQCLEAAGFVRDYQALSLYAAWR